jgi:hypothetical protein
MAGPYDFTGQNIENTYQRVLQTPDGTTFYDGTGSLVILTATAAAGGSNTQIQFNSASLLSGSSNFSFNYITNNATLSGSLNITDSIYFSGSGAASRLRWNDTDGTLDLGLKGGNVTLQIGQESVIQVINKTGINLLESEYKAVRIRRVDEGGAQGQRLAIVLAQANNDANSVDTLGLVTENINVNQEGFITDSGLVRNINTTGILQGETWVDGDVLYLSPTVPGNITKIKPQAPEHSIVIGYVVYSHQNNGKIFVKVDNGYELDELHNVRITTSSLSTGDLLIYDSGSSLWKNSKTLSGSYILSGSLRVSNGGSITGSFTGSFTGNLIGTASWANNYNEIDPIFVEKSASLATTGSNTFIGDQIITGSVNITGSLNADSQVYEVSFLQKDSPPYPSGDNLIELDQNLITNPNYTRNTNTITVNSSGLYKIYNQCRISVTSGVSGEAELAVFINNNPYRTYYINNIKQSEISTYNFSCVANLNTSDTIEFHIYSLTEPFVLNTFSKIYTSVINSYMTIEKLN